MARWNLLSVNWGMGNLHRAGSNPKPPQSPFHWNLTILWPRASQDGCAHAFKSRCLTSAWLFPHPWASTEPSDSTEPGGHGGSAVDTGATTCHNHLDHVGVGFIWRRHIGLWWLVLVVQLEISARFERRQLICCSQLAPLMQISSLQGVRSLARKGSSATFHDPRNQQECGLQE